MRSKQNITIPISFTFLGGCSELLDDFFYLTIDVCDNLVCSHREDSEPWPPFEQFQETVSTLVKNVEFRQSIDLLVDAKMDDTEFISLVGLLIGTVRRLFEANNSFGFEYVILSGSYNGFDFKSWWTWYSIVNKIPGVCKEIGGDQHIDL